MAKKNPLQMSLNDFVGPLPPIMGPYLPESVPTPSAQGVINQKNIVANSARSVLAMPPINEKKVSTQTQTGKSKERASLYGQDELQLLQGIYPKTVVNPDTGVESVEMVPDPTHPYQRRLASGAELEAAANQLLSRPAEYDLSAAGALGNALFGKSVGMLDLNALKPKPSPTAMDVAQIVNKERQDQYANLLSAAQKLKSGKDIDSSKILDLISNEVTTGKAQAGAAGGAAKGGKDILHQFRTSSKATRDSIQSFSDILSSMPEPDDPQSFVIDFQIKAKALEKLKPISEFELKNFGASDLYTKAKKLSNLFDSKKGSFEKDEREIIREGIKAALEIDAKRYKEIIDGSKAYAFATHQVGPEETDQLLQIETGPTLGAANRAFLKESERGKAKEEKESALLNGLKELDERQAKRRAEKIKAAEKNGK